MYGLCYRNAAIANSGVLGVARPTGEAAAGYRSATFTLGVLLMVWVLLIGGLACFGICFYVSLMTGWFFIFREADVDIGSYGYCYCESNSKAHGGHANKLRYSPGKIRPDVCLCYQ